MNWLRSNDNIAQVTPWRQMRSIQMGLTCLSFVSLNNVDDVQEAVREGNAKWAIETTDVFLPKGVSSV